MTPWLLFGAGSGVGACLLQRALTCNQPVILVLRDSEQARQWRERGITVVEGDACDPAVVTQACQAAGVDAVIVSTLDRKSVV